jgi:predicted CxxxxCH...CXXCH cytochrome family protein
MCHAEPNATGTALTPGPFHLNGRIDLGNGSGTCAACHGQSTGGWPTTGSHARHHAPTGGADVACGDCHNVPTAVDSPGHLHATPVAEVHLSGRAAARGQSPAFDAGTCTDVACHGAGLPGAPVPTVNHWGDASGEATRCGACHAVPPPAPHTSATNCESLLCHGGEVTPSASGPTIAPAERARHQNGSIDLWSTGP